MQTVQLALSSSPADPGVRCDPTFTLQCDKCEMLLTPVCHPLVLPGTLYVKVTTQQLYWAPKVISAPVVDEGPLMESVIGPLDRFISCPGCGNSFGV